MHGATLKIVNAPQAKFNKTTRITS